MVVKILTFVTNLGGKGPGHSAVSVDDDVYTFEEAFGGWLQSTSGWKTIKYPVYMKANAHRPILAQTIIGAKPDRIIEYVNRSIKNDDDYIGSGVCSTQVSKALEYSHPLVVFDPFGFDTPKAVYYCARELKIASPKEEYTWANGKNWSLFKGDILMKLSLDYPHTIKDLKDTGQI